VGWVANPVPFLLHIEQAEDIREVLRSTRAQLLLLPHDGLGFDVLRYMGSKEIQQRFRSLPQPQLLLNYLGRLPFQIEEAQVLNGPAREIVRSPHSQYMVDPIQICVTVILLGKILTISWHYQGNLHKRATMERLMQDFLQRLKRVPSAFGA
jgi:non-ribosomal peptide synthase protein (TIGR01720 family)